MSEDEHATTRSGGSADPHEPGPGALGADLSGTSGQLTGSLQTAANDVLGGLEEFANSAFDVGEAGLQDALKVVDAAQTGVSNALAAITAKVTGGKVEANLPTVPTGDIAGALSGGAQEAANKLLNGAEEFANHVFDVAETELEAALKVVDEAQTKVSGLLTQITGMLAGKLGPSKG